MPVHHSLDAAAPHEIALRPGRRLHRRLQQGLCIALSLLAGLGELLALWRARRRS